MEAAIGTITSVIIGVPYPKLIARADADEQMRHLAEYQQRLRRIEAAAQTKELHVHVAHVREGKVAIDRNATADGWQQAEREQP